jgi:hypothetical protein
VLPLVVVVVEGAEVALVVGEAAFVVGAAVVAGAAVDVAPAVAFVTL